MQLMALGLFVFERATMLPHELARRASWDHAESERVLARPAYQFTGPGPEEVNLPFNVVPELGGRLSAVKTLREMADAGDDYPLVDGAGEVLGSFRITSLDDTRRHMIDDGRPRIVDGTLTLIRTA